MKKKKFPSGVLCVYFTYIKDVIITYIISASDLSCLNFRPVCLYSFYMLFYNHLKKFRPCFKFFEILRTGLFRNNQIIRTTQKRCVSH